MFVFGNIVCKIVKGMEVKRIYVFFLERARYAQLWLVMYRGRVVSEGGKKKEMVNGGGSVFLFLF